MASASTCQINMHYMGGLEDIRDTIILFMKSYLRALVQIDLQINRQRLNWRDELDLMSDHGVKQILKIGSKVYLKV